jgi:hypothetical protein
MNATQQSPIGRNIYSMTDWKRFYRNSAREHIKNIRWRKANGMPYDKRILDLRYCLANRHNG